MRDANRIVRERQKAIRREIDRRGISIKAVQFDGGWECPSTVLSYFPADAAKEPAIMSVAALYRLFDALPTELLSLLLPDGFQIVRAPESIDHDTLCELAAEYVSAKNRAHHPESEAGRDIGPGEEGTLSGLVVQMVGGAAA